MRRWIVAALTATEVLVACAIFACSLQLSHKIAHSHTLGNVAAVVVRSTRTLAQNGARLRITIDNA